MFKKTLIATAIATSSLSACSTMGRLADIGKEVNDEALKTSEFTICKAASVGSIVRRFNTKELATAWINLCASPNTLPPVMLEGTLNNE